MSKRQRKYAPVITRIFFSRYTEGARVVYFERQDFETAARELGIEPAKNLGDNLYSFRFRAALPESIQATAPEGEAWVIRIVGRSRYCFALVPDRPIIPNPMMSQIKIPDSTPGLVTKYILDDEQALLAKLRYNRLIDIFTGVTCYSLQNHLRTTVPSLGSTQVETDEIYIGVDKKGVHYVFPVQAKGGTDKMSIVQIEQDVALCEAKFPNVICRPIGAQFMASDLIALFGFEKSEGGITLAIEKHYRLVASDEVTPEDLKLYNESTPNEESS